MCLISSSFFFGIGYFVSVLYDLSCILDTLLIPSIVIILLWGSLSRFILNRELAVDQRLEWNRRRPNIKRIDLGFICGRLPDQVEDSILFFDRLDTRAILLNRAFLKHRLREVELVIHGERSSYLVMRDSSTEDFIKDLDIDNHLDILMPDIEYLEEEKIEFYNDGKHLFNLIQNKDLPRNPLLYHAGILEEHRIRVSGNINSVGNVYHPRPAIRWPHVS